VNIYKSTPKAINGYPVQDDPDDRSNLCEDPVSFIRDLREMETILAEARETITALRQMEHKIEKTKKRNEAMDSYRERQLVERHCKLADDAAIAVGLPVRATNHMYK
jgi:hypothetical protein